MIMASRKLNRIVLFLRKVIKKRQVGRRWLNGRRNIGYETEGALPPGRDVRDEGEDNVYKRGIADEGDKQQARPADIQTIYEGRR